MWKYACTHDHGEFKTIVILIYVVTNWPSSWFECQYLVVGHLCYSNSNNNTNKLIATLVTTALVVRYSY